MDEVKKPGMITDLKETLASSLDIYNQSPVGSEERERESRNIERIAKALSEIKSMESEVLDREEARRIEEEKNADNARIEAEKAKTPWARIFFEAGAKVFMQLVDHAFFARNQRQVLEFEEHGVIRSKASRDLGFRFPWVKK